ncbi:hypothetical protein PRUPE_2G139300 [Prunus persica]|uniref:Hydrophobic seed protein domain-containing protein n=1 Tax=Prunus persica TaxID=3760 RepID=A0A251QFN2_PRUPE|nr:hypothetical protein PRUPE_2G139300 [Prunus persica]
MASPNAFATIALLLFLNLVFFTTMSSNDNVPDCQCSPTPPKTPKHPPPSTPTPKHPPPSTPTPKNPPPTPTPSPPKASCPKDTLKLGVCGNLLKLGADCCGDPTKDPFCQGKPKEKPKMHTLTCLCPAIKANVLGINLNVPVSLSFAFKLLW